jgi:hypothetical protein
VEKQKMHKQSSSSDGTDEPAGKRERRDKVSKETKKRRDFYEKYRNPQKEKEMMQLFIRVRKRKSLFFVLWFSQDFISFQLLNCFWKLLTLLVLSKHSFFIITCLPGWDFFHLSYKTLYRISNANTFVFSACHLLFQGTVSKVLI